VAGTNIEKNERDGVSKDLDNVVVEENDKLEYEAAHDELEKMRAGLRVL
jgi:BRCT domain type II-containing protein